MKSNKSLKKILGIVLAAGILSVLTTGCSSAPQNNDLNSTSSEVTEASQKIFRLGVNGSSSSGMLMEIAGLAYKNGYLEDELENIGYGLEVTPMPGGPVINEALASNNLDAAIYGDFPAFTSKSNGIDTTVVANLNSKFQCGILVAADKADIINEPKDLEGKKIIIQLGTSIQYFWEQYVKYYGLDDKNIQIINASSDANSLLSSGEADAYVSSLYSISYLESLGLGKVFDDGSEVTEGVTTFVFEISTDLLKNDPNVGVAVNKALIRAYDDATADPNVLYEAVSSEYMTAEIMASEYAFDTSLSYTYPEITPELIDYYGNLNEWLYDHSIISEKVEVNTFFDNSYFTKAVEELGRE